MKLLCTQNILSWLTVSAPQSATSARRGNVIGHNWTVTKKTYIRIMEKVLKITTIKDNSSDFAYWTTKSLTERLDTIEILRQQYFSLKKDVQPRLQRVCRIINQV